MEELPPMRCLTTLTVISLLLSAVCGCQSDDFIIETDFMLDTVCTITLYEPKDPNLAGLCFNTARELEKILSRTQPGSDVYKINRSKDNPVIVSDDTITVLNAGIHYGEVSGGMFDITIAPAIDLWDFSIPSLPDPEKLKYACNLVDYRRITIDGNTVTLPKDMALDLGGLAKGYIADKMAEFLRKNGVTSALVDLGGDIVAIGSKPDGSPFRVGIQIPFAVRGEVSETIELSDMAVATSGTYERSFTLNGKLYHHILDPHTGYPADCKTPSSTVTAKTAMDADAMATIQQLIVDN